MAEAIPEKPSSAQVSGTVPWSEKGCWGGRPFGVFGTKGDKSVPRGHVKLKSTPSESHRIEIQLDKLGGDGCRAAQGRAVMDVWPLIWTPCSPLIMWTRFTARSAPHLHTVGPAFGNGSGKPGDGDGGRVLRAAAGSVRGCEPEARRGCTLQGVPGAP